MIHYMEWVQCKEGLRLLVLIRWRKNKIIYFYCLFNNNVSGSDYTGSVNNKLERQWKKAVVAETEVLFETLCGGTEEKKQKSCQNTQCHGQEPNWATT